MLNRGNTRWRPGRSAGAGKLPWVQCCPMSRPGCSRCLYKHNHTGTFTGWGVGLSKQCQQHQHCSAEHRKADQHIKDDVHGRPGENFKGNHVHSHSPATSRTIPLAARRYIKRTHLTLTTRHTLAVRCLRGGFTRRPLSGLTRLSRHIHSLYVKQRICQLQG